MKRVEYGLEVLMPDGTKLYVGQFWALEDYVTLDADENACLWLDENGHDPNADYTPIVTIDETEPEPAEEPYWDGGLEPWEM